jgi:hypothetical protein
LISEDVSEYSESFREIIPLDLPEILTVEQAASCSIPHQAGA